MATWRHDRPAARIRRLKPSFSASPRQMWAKACSKFSSSARRRSPDRGLDLEVLDVHRHAVGIQAVRVLGDHPQAHVLHHRQRIRQRDVVVLAIELEAQAARRRWCARYRLRRRSSGPSRAARCSTSSAATSGRHVLDVARRQRTAVAAGQLQAALLAVPRDQLLAQVVLPVAHDLGELAPRSRRCRPAIASPDFGSHDAGAAAPAATRRAARVVSTCSP